MPFRSYHRFANRARLENLVSTLNDNGNITDDAYNNFYRYHPAMIHKLKSAKHNLDSLTEKLTSTDIQEAAVPTGDFMFEVNMFIDGFFYNSGSALDILGRVVLALFGQSLAGNVYFQTAHTRISQNRAGDPILPRLTNPTWRSTFSDYRNTLTHELILASRYQIEIDNSGASPSTRILFPLPDDPRADPQARQYRRNPDVIVYTEIHFTRILSLANTIYGDIISRVGTGGSLPL